MPSDNRTIVSDPGPALRGNALAERHLLENINSTVQNNGPDDLFARQVSITGGSFSDPTYTLGAPVTIAPKTLVHLDPLKAWRLNSAGKSNVTVWSIH